MNLRFILPTGSLADAIRKYLKAAGYDVPPPDRRGFCGIVNGVEFWQLDRRTIPQFLQTGKYDAGITGRDLLIASGVERLQEVCPLNFSRSSEQPTRWVLAVSTDRNPPQTVRIGCELPQFAEKILRGKIPFSFEVVPICGSEEQCVRDGIVDMVLVITETGSSLKANGLGIVPGCENLFESVPVIVRSQNHLSLHADMQLAALAAALRSTIGAAQHVMVFFNIERAVDLVYLNRLPTVTAPTIAPLTLEGWRACTICIPINEQGSVLARLEEMGARGIVVTPVQGYLA